MQQDTMNMYFNKNKKSILLQLRNNNNDYCNYLIGHNFRSSEQVAKEQSAAWTHAQ